MERGKRRIQKELLTLFQVIQYPGNGVQESKLLAYYVLLGRGRDTRGRGWR